MLVIKTQSQKIRIKDSQDLRHVSWTNWLGGTISKNLKELVRVVYIVAKSLTKINNKVRKC